MYLLLAMKPTTNREPTMTFREVSSAKPGQRVLAISYCGEVRYFIAPGFSGFNTPTNNRRGYSTENRALDVSLHYEAKGIASRA